jgi:hypothetical protein
MTKMGMTSSNPLTTFGVAVALTLAANASGAAPLGHGSDAMAKANATSDLIEQVHGTHRACVRGWIPRWGMVRRHRHVGVAHVPVRC